VITNLFYGPWLIRSVPHWKDQSFLIAGSENADGRYGTERGTPIELLVEGESWTIQLDRLEHGSWIPAIAYPASPDGGAARSTEFDPALGLVVRLASGTVPWLPLGSDIFRLGIDLTCICQDPDTNPEPTTPPPDFTVPHGPTGRPS
jgi:hypothetical protein